MLKQCHVVLLSNLFERCVITKGVKTTFTWTIPFFGFERCVITKGVKTIIEVGYVTLMFERCVITKGVKTRGAVDPSKFSLRGV